MITIELGSIEYYDDTKNQFIYDEGGTVRFEYSLKVIYDWENRWRKPFLKGGLTDEEQMDFYITMALDPIKKEFINGDVVNTLSKYIADSNTATTFTTIQDGGGTSGVNRSYTSEEIYALMFSAGIPLEFENRNLNRLLAILKIISSYNNPPKKMNKQDILKQNASLNAQRKAQLKTKG